MSIRIISGRCRGRHLWTPRDSSIRPTPGIVRERLFSWLGPHLADANVLDLFAGSGALGLEAWSRGAGMVHFVEKDPGHRQGLLRNLQHCGLDADSLVDRDALHLLGNRTADYDLILLDPPFGGGWPQRLAPYILKKNGPLRPEGWVYLETSAAEQWSPEELPGPWSIHRQGHCGKSHYALLHYQPENR